MSDKNKLIKFIQNEVKKIHKIHLLEQRIGEIEGKLKILKENDNYGYPSGADSDPHAPWRQSSGLKQKDAKENHVIVNFHNNEVAIAHDSGGANYAFYIGDMKKDDFASYSEVPGHWERDEDGGGSFVSNLEGWDIDNDAIEEYINDNWNEIKKGVGLKDWEDGIDFVVIDDELAASLRETYGEEILDYV